MVAFKEQATRINVTEILNSTWLLCFHYNLLLFSGILLPSLSYIQTTLHVSSRISNFQMLMNAKVSTVAMDRIVPTPQALSFAPAAKDSVQINLDRVQVGY